MSPQQAKEQPCLVQAGPLGYLEGITITGPAASSEHQSLIHYFGGLPYALPPLGPHRFTKTRPLPDHYRYGTKASPGCFNRKAALCPQPNSMSQADKAIFDEDCLQLNIYIPATTDRPSGGWPVLFYIHGGFLQWGGPNMPPSAIAKLLSETALKAIIVQPGYRLNLFGFLSSQELEAEGKTSGNYGFWDQRCALEWTAANIGHFGGDAGNFTIAGYSAGSHSVFHQLSHELFFVPDNKAIIKRAIMWSNGPGVQPRTAAEHQAQFDELLSRLHIPASLSGSEKLKRLRQVSIEDFVRVADLMTISEFRATTDDAFVSSKLMTSIGNGDYGRRMKRRGITLMNGECRDEHNLYRAWRTPQPSYNSVRTRLIADFPAEVVDRIMLHYCGPTKSLPTGSQGWQDLFGRIYADMQVHHLERGFHHGLQLGGLRFGKDVLRYRIDWRAKCLDTVYPLEWEVCHASDMVIWFWGHTYGEGLLDHEKELLRPWNQAFADFVHGKDPQWGTTGAREMKRLRADGTTDVWVDDQWDEGVQVSDKVNARATGITGWIKSVL